MYALRVLRNTTILCNLAAVLKLLTISHIAGAQIRTHAGVLHVISADSSSNITALTYSMEQSFQLVKKFSTFYGT